MMRQNVRTFVILAAVVVGTISCSSVACDGKSPVYLVIMQLLAARGGVSAGQLSGTLHSDVITNVTSPSPCSPASPCATIFSDAGQVQLRMSPKDVGPSASPPAPSLNNEVTITRYRVVYRRADGRNTPGVDVPYGFDGGVTGTVPTGGTLTLNFEIVRHIAKQESPLVELQTSGRIISTIADVTFYGRDQVGNEIQTTGQILIEFGNFGD